MSYEIPQQLQYKEKIIFGLTFHQLAYCSVFSLLTIFCFRLPLPFAVRFILSSIPITLGLMFMFFDLASNIRAWMEWLCFLQAKIMSSSMKRFLGIYRIYNDCIYKDIKCEKKVAIIKAEPINFSVKANDAKEAVIIGFQRFLNGLEFPIQILMTTSSVNLDDYLKKHRERTERISANNHLVQESFDEYEQHLRKTIATVSNINRIFYIAIPENDLGLRLQCQMIMESLKAMDIKCQRLNDEELIKALSGFFSDVYEDEDKTEYLKKNKINSISLSHFLVSPSSVKNNPSSMLIDGKWQRVIAAKGYPRSVEPGFLDRIISTPGSFDISIHIAPQKLDSTMITLNRELQKQRADLYALELKQSMSPILDMTYNDTRAVLDIIQKGSEKLFDLSFYARCRADSKEELDMLCKRMESELNGSMIQPSIPLFRMKSGIQSIIPLCNNALNIKRNITTRPLSAFFPFTSKFLQVDEQGIWLGLNKNDVPIIKDPFQLVNPNGFILATSGSGKSYAAKLYLRRQWLNGTEISVIDPQGEYNRQIDNLGGQNISFSKDSKECINVLDLMGHDFGEKRLSLMELFQVMLGFMSEVQKGVLDRAITNVYLKKGINADPSTWSKTPPVLGNLRDELELMSKSATMIEKETYRSLINRLSLYVDGVFSFMNRHTKVDFKNTLRNYDLSGMPKPVKPVYMFLILDMEYVRMKKDLKRKMLIIDEAWSLLGKAEEAGYIFEIVKTSRKFNLSLLLITQEVADLLENRAGRAVLANTSFTLLLGLKSAVIKEVAETFQLSTIERDRLLSAKVGEGILIVENDHSEIKIIASEKEHEFITTKADELVNNSQNNANGHNIKNNIQNKKIIANEQKIEPVQPASDKQELVMVNPADGMFRKKDLNSADIDYLLRQGYIISSHVGLGGGQRDDYLLMPRQNESPAHFFLVKAIEECLKKHTNDVHIFTTAQPDIIFRQGGQKWAVEVETGVSYDKRKDILEEKAKTLNRQFGKHWFFVVTNAEYCYKYQEYGEVYTRKNIEQKIRKVFRR